ncbi:hypothetical protein JS562_54430 [Agrobacterium sp. S2]|nr:hypothetical protein [Agrobacterium sp. S2]
MTDAAPVDDTAEASSDAAEPLELTDDEVTAVFEAENEVESVGYQGTDFDAEELVRRLDRSDIIDS